MQQDQIHNLGDVTSEQSKSLREYLEDVVDGKKSENKPKTIVTVSESGKE